MTANAFAHADAVSGTTSPGHIGVSEVIRGVGTALRRAYPTSLWVKGEVSDYRVPAQGHHYFNLIERHQDGSQAVLPCAVWKSNWQQVRQKLFNGGIALTSGQQMLFLGTVRLYDGAGKLTFHVSDVYPEFTLGQIEAHRRAVLARLQMEQLIGPNRRLEMPAVPLRVAVLSSRNAAGLQDFEEVLRNSGYAFSVLRCEVPVQGPMVERAVCRALEVLALKHTELRLDAICIVRGGGSATDLGWWNSYAICAAIAKMPVPVITGIGHERDRVAADEVAHTALPTPTGAAEFLSSLACTADACLQATKNQFATLATQRFSYTTQALNTLKATMIRSATTDVAQEQVRFHFLREQATSHARRSLAPHTQTLVVCKDTLRRHAQHLVQRATATIQETTADLIGAARLQSQNASSEVDAQSVEVVSSSERQLTNEAEIQTELQSAVVVSANREIGECQKSQRHLAEMVEAHDPVRILRRGFSITLNSQGKAVKCANDVISGDRIITRLGLGQILSTVTQETS